MIYLWCAIALVCFLLLYRYMKYKSLYVIVALIGVIGVFANPVYSGADEGAHFNNVNYILDQHTLPTTRELINSSQLLSVQQYVPVTGVPGHYNHEAFHPPLYYLLASAAGFIMSIFTDNLLWRLYAIRFMGVALLLVSAFFLEKTYTLMASKGIIRENLLLFTAVSAIFLISPNFMAIMIPANNEHLVLALVSMVIYLFVSGELSGNNNTRSIKGAIVTSLMVSALLLTKLTTAYIAIIIGGLYILKRDYKHLVIYGVVTLLIISPWLLLNLANYGELTAMDEHIEIVQPIVNPGNVPHTIAEIANKFPGFLTSVWFKDRSGAVPVITIFLSIISAMAVILPIILAASGMVKRYFLKHAGVTGVSDDNARKRLFIMAVFSIFILSSLFYLIYITLNTPIYSVVGRYMFMNLSCFVFLFYGFQETVFGEKYLKYAAYFYVAIAAVFIAVNLNGLLST